MKLVTIAVHQVLQATAILAVEVAPVVEAVAVVAHPAMLHLRKKALNPMRTLINLSMSKNP
jgi:hypothetical protein